MPRTLNNSSARILDPIASNHARTYTNRRFIAEQLAPSVSIPLRGMQVIKFNKDSFRQYNSRRAPGASTERVQFGYGADPVSLYQEALEAVVPREHAQEASQVPGIDLAALSINGVLDIFALNREIMLAEKVLNPANYANSHKVTLAAADKWSVAEVDPAVLVDDYKEVIRRSTGVNPNTLAFGADAFKALRRHPKIREQFKYTQSATLTREHLKEYFDIERIVVGDAIYLPETKSDKDLAEDIWAKDAILAYVPNSGNFMEPAFAYSYLLKGHPFVEKPYFDVNAKSWVYGVTTEHNVYLVGDEAGVLLKGVV